MPKGKSGGKRGRDVAYSVVTQSGDTADLKDNPLKYTQNEGLTDAVRQYVDTFASKRQTAKAEYGVLIQDDGTELINKRGGTGSVALPTWLYNRSDVMMHNHPRSDPGEQGLLGGPFSSGRTSDINTFFTTNIHTMYATAAEGNYWIHKEQGFDGPGLGRYAYAEDRKAEAAHYQRVLAIRQQTNLTPQEKREKMVESANRWFVDYHNALLAGQKKYGYSYGLERRK